MNGVEFEAMQARVRKAQRWLRFTLLGWIVSVGLLVVGWILTVALLGTTVRLFDALAALP